MKRLLESSLEQLITLEPSLVPGTVSSFYSRILISYLQSDLQALGNLRDELNQRQNALSRSLGERQIDFLIALSDLRLSIRKREISDQAIYNALKVASDDPLYAGEALFVVAMAYDIRKEHVLCKEYNLRAARKLEKAGVVRKSLIALHNAVAAESRLDSSKNLLLDYYRVYRGARKNRVRGVAGLALNNMAREFQIMGALKSALRCSNKAIISLQEDSGAIQYYLALLNRCHILLEMGRNAEAWVDFESAKIAPFAEIREALQVLAPRFQKMNNAAGSTTEAGFDLLPTWSERAQNFSLGIISSPLTLQEDQLIRVLSEGPVEKGRIGQKLYGDRLTSEVIDNRLKSLLYRLDRKRPGLICREGAFYFLSGGAKGRAELNLGSIASKRPTTKRGLTEIKALGVLDKLIMESRNFSEFHAVFRKARRSGSRVLAGQALYQIADRYLRIGAYSIALKYANRAIGFLDEDRGEFYHYALMLRIYILDAFKTEEEPSLGFTAMEERLIELIRRKPCTRFDIAEQLYGARLSLQTTDNRVKNLISRVKAKRPGMIILENGVYRVAEPFRIKEAV